MLQVNEALAARFGLDDLNPDRRRAFLNQYARTIQERVGTRLSANLDPDQLQSFDLLARAADDAGAAAWLNENVPGYQDITRHEIEKLNREITSSVASIRAVLENAPRDAIARLNLAAANDEHRIFVE